MKVLIKKDGVSEQELEFAGTVKELLVKLDINPEAYLVAVNNELVEEDEQVTNEDTVTIISVVSGG